MTSVQETTKSQSNINTPHLTISNEHRHNISAQIFAAQVAQSFCLIGAIQAQTVTQTHKVRQVSTGLSSLVGVLDSDIFKTFKNTLKFQVPVLIGSPP